MTLDFNVAVHWDPLRYFSPFGARHRELIDAVEDMHPDWQFMPEYRVGSHAHYHVIFPRNPRRAAILTYRYRKYSDPDFRPIVAACLDYEGIPTDSYFISNWILDTEHHWPPTLYERMSYALFRRYHNANSMPEIVFDASQDPEKYLSMLDIDLHQRLAYKLIPQGGSLLHNNTFDSMEDPRAVFSGLGLINLDAERYFNGEIDNLWFPTREMLQNAGVPIER